MSGPVASPARSKLRRLAQRRAEPAEVEERCDLCGELIPPDHRHLLDLEKRELMCSCKACSLLFDRAAAGGGHFRLVPDRRLEIADFELSDADWERLQIPVEMAFFFRRSDEEGINAFYPSPMGATQSALGLDAWEQIEAANPIVRELEPDVEALLINRAGGARRYWLVPIDDCYDLVGLIRTRWKGLSGGKEVWKEVEQFFERLSGRSRPIGKSGKTTTAGTGERTGAKEAR